MKEYTGFPRHADELEDLEARGEAISDRFCLDHGAQEERRDREVYPYARAAEHPPRGERVGSARRWPAG